MRRKILLFLLPLLFKLIISLIGLTCRIRWNNKAIFDDHYDNQKPFILSFWHENVLIIPWLLRNRGITCMVSDSRDGEYIARSGLVFGNKVVRGSSSKGATKATRAALKLLKNKETVAITPDGPRGPAHQLQDGVLWLGALGNVPIIPFHIEVDRQHRFKSWDQQKIPKLFSTIHVSVGEPYFVQRQQLTDEQQLEKVRAAFQQQMMENTNIALKNAGYEIA